MPHFPFYACFVQEGWNFPVPNVNWKLWLQMNKGLKQPSCILIFESAFE